ncbi:MinD/ParA family ATP-binding protein [Undibacterium sp. TJN19]|uniref:MinD/ParA family ATP-binding protein n=1 Tax=Undibacterium sp. TJN19 TaxID=3413055 RepID=UPI003BF42B99
MARFDQAEGLRRMLAGPKPRVFTFLSALKEDEKSGMLVNLGVTLARQGNQVTMVDARASEDSIGAWLNASNDQTLLDVAQQQRTMKEAIKIVAAGLSVTMLTRNADCMAKLPPEGARQLSRVFDVVAHRSDLVIVDSEINLEAGFPLASLDDSELVIQVSADPDMIKAAYGLIKRVSNRLGRRGYGILVSGASEKEARLIYTNMAQAAGRYLAVPLHYVGNVPDDEHLRKAAHLGRSVIDAFPKARASLAFSRLAEQLAMSARTTLGIEGVPELGVGLGI